MTLQDIKEVFGIDLTESDRRPHIVYLRGQYIDQEIKKGRRKLHICRDLKCNHASVFHYLVRKPKYKFVPEYQEVKKAFKNKDVKLFLEIDFKLTNKKYIRYDNFDKKPKIKKSNMPKVRWHYLRIIEALRKDNKNKLWDKPMKEFTKKDYKVLEKLENAKTNS